MFADFLTQWRAVSSEEVPRFARLPEGDYPFLSPAEAQFLHEVGLPRDDFDFRFHEVEKGLPPINRVYGPNDVWTQSQLDAIAPWRVLGSDAGGNPLCLHTTTHEIWLLDHEGSWHPFVLVAHSLNSLLEVMLLFQREAYDENISDTELQARLRKLNPKLALDSYWSQWLEDRQDLLL